MGRAKSRRWVVAASCLAGLAVSPMARAAADPALIAHGKYLATAGDCEACHTATGGTPLAGGLYMNTPFGPISTPNITPDPDTGIGKITDDQFYRVFHNGIGMQGEHLYPVMPFPWFTKVTRDDVLAIKAYLFSLPPVHAPRKPNKMAFPFNIRAALVGWDMVFLKDGTFKPDPGRSAQVNRGAYLVQGLAHCGECHNAHSMFGDSAMAESLRGGPIDQWYAPNITSDTSEGIGRFSDATIYRFLKTGSAPGMGVVVGPMAQTMHESLGKLTDDDLHAIVAYLKTTPPKEGFKKRAAPAAGSERALSTQMVYLNYCASCHQQNGQGLAKSVPPLAGNGAVTAGGPQTVIRVILGGIEAQGSFASMPAIGVRMSDQEVADVTNYVRAAWGNAAPAQAGPGQVASLRKATQSLLAMNTPNCPTIADPRMVAAITSPDVARMLKATTEETMLQNGAVLITKVQQAVPHAGQAEVINALTRGYCPVVKADTALKTQAQQAELLDEFAERLYTEFNSKGQD